MENRTKIKIVVATIACVAAISMIVASKQRKRRKQKGSQIQCYLKTDTKPQDSFKRVLADNSYSPFKHLKVAAGDSNESNSVSHPYEAEITALLERPTIELGILDGEMDLRMSESYVWVDSEPGLQELADTLSRERFFAVDTEQHSLRSFLGFTALIQISTLKDDYLVDTIALHDAMGILRHVFANPNICKVFHGADNDVLWLQRDYHIYVVNLFDTAKACEVLLKPQKSLAYLLETYCNVATNKLLQREDWRERPLSVEMVRYARTDAHYLLYIADCLTSELKQLDNACLDDKFHFVLEASRRSNMICLQLYTKEIAVCPGESAAASIFSRYLTGQGGVSSKHHETKFQDLVRQLCTWRDLMARLHDESLRYVLSDHAIVVLADKVPLTQIEICNTISQADQNMDSVSLNSSPSSPSPVICSHLDDLYDLLQDNSDDSDAIFLMILENHIGANGSCPLSIYNYALLSRSNLKLTNRIVSKQKGVKNAKQKRWKASRELFVQKFSCKSPVYHNCRIYASDGRLLCYCDRRKLEWYLRRDLAKLVDENPPAIMLLFEPKGRPEDEDNDFYIQSKKNICVGCGEGNHYLRYRIIPSCYRIHFPEHLKSHRSHDIVLLCVDCHEVAHSAAEKYKKQIATEFGIPLFVQNVVDSKQAQVVPGSSVYLLNLEQEGVSPLQLRTAAMALLRHGPRMPSKRREELTQIIKKYYGGRKISEEDLERALLVGMSPHERRRLEKKRGLSLKNSADNICLDKERKVGVYASTDSLEPNTLDGLHANGGEALSHQEDKDFSLVMDANTSNPTICSDLLVNGEVATSDDKIIKSDESEASEAKEIYSLNPDDTRESRCSSNGMESDCLKSNVTASPKHNSKLSLLGHGPHGKQVVDHILKEYGEDGIRLFCQRWRQGFVEALHPRFLPGGWDVMHSGRREFGEFSVYNPANKAPTAVVSVNG